MHTVGFKVIHRVQRTSHICKDKKVGALDTCIRKDFPFCHIQLIILLNILDTSNEPKLSNNSTIQQILLQAKQAFTSLLIVCVRKTSHIFMPSSHIHGY